MIRTRIPGIIPQKAGLIRINPPVHRREKKSLNRSNCGHDLRLDQAGLCGNGKKTCFGGKIKVFPPTIIDVEFGVGAGELPVGKETWLRHH